MITKTSRRRWLKTTSLTLVAIPIIAISARALANVNAATRAQLKYQGHPLEGKSCATCLEFIPANAVADLGGCKKIPDDSEISPNGYCTLWNTM
jgi:hypothetical protein